MAKRIEKNMTGLDRSKFYSLDEAVKLMKARANAKFNETIEVAMNLGVDPRHSDQMVRGVCTLPNGSGRTVRVGVFAKGAKAEEAKKAGADVVGAEDLFEIVNKGTIDFDRCIATPDMMGLVGRLGKVLRAYPQPCGRGGRASQGVNQFRSRRAGSRRRWPICFLLRAGGGSRRRTVAAQGRRVDFRQANAYRT